MCPLSLQEKLVRFYQYLEEKFPPTPGTPASQRSFSTDALNLPGCTLRRRPSSLPAPFASDHGCCLTEATTAFGVARIQTLALKEPECSGRQDVQRLLVQLICLNGFGTNPDVPGCEKVVTTLFQKQWLTKPPDLIATADLSCQAVEFDPLLLSPQTAFMVKGWNRCCCALIFLLATSELPPLLEVRWGL